MRLHRFFIDENIGDAEEVVVTDSGLLNQWRHVLRLNTGASVILLDNSGYEYLAQFGELTFRRAVFLISQKRKNKCVPKRELFLFQSLIKPDRFEWQLEKGTELGVAHFRPVITHHTVQKKLNLERARRIVRESAEQSGRGVLPALYEPMTLEESLSSYQLPSIAFDPSGVPFRESNFLNLESISVFIGPEGGWSEQELALFRAKNIPLISLGPATLRAETAAIAVSALLLL